ncbi:MAG TPA: hypothetical protein VF570_14155, partial [Pyrinomonadaceae bacterium]
MSKTLLPTLSKGLTRALAVLFALAAFGTSAAAQHAQGAGAGSGAQTGHRPGGEANLLLPDLSSQSFLGVDGHTLLLVGLAVCVLGLAFGLVIFTQLKNLPVHRSMR